MNGKNIGVNTEGDNGGTVTKSINMLNFCDVVICPTKSGLRSKNESLGTIQEYVRNNYKSIDVIPLFKIIYNNKTIDDKAYLHILKNILFQYI